MAKSSNPRPTLALLGLASLLGLAAGAFFPGDLIWKSYHDGGSIRAWLGVLEHGDPAARRRAAHALGAIGPEAKEAVPLLASRMIEDVDRSARIEAALALVKMGLAAQPALPSLIGAMTHRDPVLRYYAALAILRLGKVARPAVPALIRAIQDERNDTNCLIFSSTISEVAVVALGSSSAGTSDGVATLLEYLSYADRESTRQSTARALGKIGPEARQAEPQLRALLFDQDDTVRDAALEALHSLGVTCANEEAIH